MIKKSLFLPYLLPFVITGCETWDLEKRPDHDYFLKNEIFKETTDGEGQALIQTSDGGFAIAGKIVNNGNYDICLYKLDEFGERKGTFIFGDNKNEEATFLVETNDGYLLLGNKTISENNSDAIIIKTDKTGISKWTKFPGDSLDDKAYALVVKNDLILAVGESSKYMDRNLGIETLLFPINSNGEILEDKNYDYRQNKDDMGIYMVYNNNKFVILSYCLNDNSKYDLYLITIDENLKIDFNAFPVKILENCLKINNSFIAIDNSNYLIAATLTGNEVILVKTNLKGQISKKETFTSINCNSYISLIKTKDNGYAFLTGKMILVKLNSNLEKIWENEYKDVTTSGNHCLIHTNDNGFAMVGKKDNKIIFIKTDPEGNTLDEE